MWNPEAYLAFADQRGRPFFELLSRVGAQRPRRVVDLGCGPGNLTVDVTRRWPQAAVEAWDSSPQMVAAACDRGVDAHLGDVRAWTPTADTDVVLSNAALQWVPEHPALLVRWAGQLAAGSWIAMQVPGNFDAPSHRVVRALASTPRWSELLTDLPFREGPVVESPSGYAETLTDAGCSVDAWETTYVHELSGEHPVLEWITGTALVPIKSRLAEREWLEFREELTPLLGAAYPARRNGKTLFPFRRVFVVAQVN